MKKPLTMQQRERRRQAFWVRYEGQKSWFYLFSSTASFHQITPSGQHNVHGISIKRLIAALKACGYIVLFLLVPVFVEAEPVFICNGADCRKAVIDRQTWMAKRAANPYSYLCVDTTQKNYRIVPCEYSVKEQK